MKALKAFSLVAGAIIGTFAAYSAFAAYMRKGMYG